MLRHNAVWNKQFFFTVVVSLEIMIQWAFIGIFQFLIDRMTMDTFNFFKV